MIATLNASFFGNSPVAKEPIMLQTDASLVDSQVIGEGTVHQSEAQEELPHQTTVKRTDSTKGQISTVVLEDHVGNTLQGCNLFWKEISDNFIYETIKEGYKIPFRTTPTNYGAKNNASALNKPEFVAKTIKDLLRSKCITEVFSPPTVVNPLTVSCHNDKLRLILDLRHVNNHIFKFPVKYEGLDVLSQYVEKEGYIINFDLKSGYHHLGIFPDHRQYLGFAWKINGNLKYFTFSVLPFGLSSACNIFTKILRPFVKRWRAHGAKIVMYLDDGVCTAKTQVELNYQVLRIRDDLRKAGFIVNESKSNWNPKHIVTWLGFVINLNRFEVSLPEEKVDKIVIILNKYSSNDSMSRRQLASVIGKITSTYPALGPIVFYRTKELQKKVISLEVWDFPFPLDSNTKSELKFWSDYFQIKRSKSFAQEHKKHITIFSDASATGGGSFQEGHERSFCHFIWNHAEAAKSSTYRELKTVWFSLLSFKDLRDTSVSWYTDCMNVCAVLRKGSMNIELNNIALEIYHISIERNIQIEPKWINRKFNTHADYISKIIDIDDWAVTDEIYDYLNKKWGPFTYDRFASYLNRKCLNYNSKYQDPFSNGVDAFRFNWKGHNNWLVPPIAEIGNTLQHLKKCRAMGVLVVPKWQSAYYWPLLTQADGRYQRGVKDVIEFLKPNNFFKSDTSKIFNGNFKSDVAVFLLNFME